MLNIFRALPFPSSGAHDYSADYHIGRSILGLLLVGSYVQAGWISVRASCCSRTYRKSRVDRSGRGILNSFEVVLSLEVYKFVASFLGRYFSAVVV